LASDDTASDAGTEGDSSGSLVTTGEISFTKYSHSPTKFRQILTIYSWFWHVHTWIHTHTHTDDDNTDTSDEEDDTSDEEDDTSDVVDHDKDVEWVKRLCRRLVIMKINKGLAYSLVVDIAKLIEETVGELITERQRALIPKTWRQVHKWASMDDDVEIPKVSRIVIS
jgi:hypothetical protein